MDAHQDLARLQQMTVRDLRDLHLEVFGEPTGSHHRQYLVRRLAWRIQSQREGGLSERARRRAAELAREADLRTTPPTSRRRGAEPDVLVLDGPVRTGRLSGTHRRDGRDGRDPRLPPPGTVLVRPYKGRRLRVRVLDEGFEYEGTVYRTLSSLARHITGSHTNGYLFFRLEAKP